MAAANPLPQTGPTDMEFKIHHFSEPRPATPASEKVMAVGFYAILFTQIVMGFMCIAAKNGALVFEINDDGSWADCPEGMVRHDGMCFSEDLMKEHAECEAALDGRKLSSLFQLDESLWSFCERNAGIVAGVFLAMIVVAVLWIFALRKAAKFVVWGTFAFCIAMLFVVPMAVDEPPQFVTAAILAVVLLVFRKNVNVAALIIQEACKALEENPSIWFHCSIIQAMYAGYVVFWVAAMMASANVYEVDEVCYIVRAPNSLPLDFMVFGFVFTTAFFDNAKTIITATTVVNWYFPAAGREDHGAVQANQGSPGFTGMRWAFVEMSGASSVSAVITTIVNYLRYNAESKCVCMTTCGIWWLLWKCVAGCVQQFARFALIGGVISGKPFFEAATWTYNSIKKHLGQGIITGSVAGTVLGAGCYILSTSLAIGAMEAGLKAMELDSMAETLGGGYMVFAIFLAYMISMPYLMIILMGFIGSMSMPNEVVAVLFGIFVGSIATLFFGFVAQFVLNATDVIYMCFCIERARGHGQTERFSGLYSMIKEHVADGTVAQNIEVGRPVGGGNATGVAPPIMAHGQVAQMGEEKGGV